MVPRSRYDAIVVGSGLGGSSLAFTLAARGLRTLVIERGDFIKPLPGVGGDPIDRSLPAFMYARHKFAFVGGASKFYGAALYRLRENDFREIRQETGASPAWPITYADLEPHYCEAERLFRVHGAPEGDPSEPPRSAPYPFAPLPHDPLVAELTERLRAGGASVSAIPLGLDQGPGGSCVMCGACDGHFCVLDAKMDAEIAVLRPAMRTGLVDLVTRCECVRVLTDPAGTRATGVLLKVDDREQEVHADVVGVSCGIPGTALLLRRSRTAAHPEGLGNGGGAVGRYLGGHHAGMIFPLTGWKPIGTHHTKTFAMNGHYHGSSDWPYPMGVIQMGGQMPVWEGLPRFVRPLAKAFGTRSLSMFYMTEATPTREAGIVFAGDEMKGHKFPPRSAKTIARLRKLAASAVRAAGYRVFAPPLYMFWHPVGTARMGDDPATSVADANGMVHGIRGLYVADASVIPSAGAVNTALTIIALALRTGAAMVE
jgi:choline dehydrogenase-like flavoprotein